MARGKQNSKQIQVQQSHPAPAAAKITAATYPISREIPIPESRGRLAKYPWARLQVGWSFFVAGKGTNDMGPCMRAAGIVYESKYCSRTVEENGVRGVRVWRVE